MYDHNRIKNHINGVESCSYELFGAHIENGGVYFSVYAPGAVNVKLIASYNGWQEIQMDRDVFGVWNVFIDGIGEAKACSIVAAIELSKRLISDHKGAVRVKIRDSRQVAEILMEEMMYEKREFFMTLNLNSKLQVESKSVISIGNLDSAPVHPREVFGPAVRRGAAAVVVAHNHPSGDPTPSPQDIDVTKRLIKASEILGIKLLDHVIIGNGCFTSMKSEGYFGD